MFLSTIMIQLVFFIFLEVSALTQFCLTGLQTFVLLLSLKAWISLVRSDVCLPLEKLLPIYSNNLHLIHRGLGCRDIQKTETAFSSIFKSNKQT